MKTQHTPGPWASNHSSDAKGNFIYIYPLSVDRKKERIARIELPKTSMGKFENEDESEKCFANARLIAAAPDMLSALRNCKDFFICNGITGSYLDMVKATIAKATGEKEKAG